ncbi:MAG: gliding motility-associated C-terminal domain-containing protein [Bacteroidales bacterium]|nr:gliding motility-associated C-terminal domain-containing protein [Bacteroidales bacterium]
MKGTPSPADSTKLFINAVTGDLIWDAPQKTGRYNIAINIAEYRNGVKIGNVVRDMQIDVYSSNNSPPVNGPLTSYCTEAGDTLKSVIQATDDDGDQIAQVLSGGPFILDYNKARFVQTEATPGFAKGTFTWATGCEHVRDELYYIVVEAKDILDVVDKDTLKSTDSDNFTIKITGPAPDSLQAASYADSILLTWKPCPCENIQGYEIYRKKGSFIYIADSCATGIPQSLGFEKVGTTTKGQSRFADIRSPNNIQQGQEYCYLVVARFNNGTLGRVSEKTCGALIQGEPSIIKVSVEKADPASGQMLVGWLPIDSTALDSLNAVQPYRYIVNRKLPGETTFAPIASIENNIVDTLYADTNINTLIYPYYYRIDFEYTNQPNGNTATINGGQASSSYMLLSPTDNAISIELLKDSPWINRTDSIFLIEEQGPALVAQLTDTNRFEHSQLLNNRAYNYFYISHGEYTSAHATYYTRNISHPASATPVDNLPPCTPLLQVTQNCDSTYNMLQWQFSNDSCLEDVYKYLLYYAPYEFQELLLFDSLNWHNGMKYIHIPSFSLSGCYQVATVDSFGNKSAPSEIVCADDCQYFFLPNVFTPNGDNHNDFFVSSYVKGYIKSVYIEIFNRWGQLMFKTNDIDINWDGRYYKTTRLYLPGFTTTFAK